MLLLLQPFLGIPLHGQISAGHSSNQNTMKWGRKLRDPCMQVLRDSLSQPQQNTMKRGRKLRDPSMQVLPNQNESGFTMSTSKPIVEVRDHHIFLFLSSDGFHTDCVTRDVSTEWSSPRWPIELDRCCPKNHTTDSHMGTLFGLGTSKLSKNKTSLVDALLLVVSCCFLCLVRVSNS